MWAVSGWCGSLNEPFGESPKGPELDVRFGDGPTKVLQVI